MPRPERESQAAAGEDPGRERRVGRVKIDMGVRFFFLVFFSFFFLLSLLFLPLPSLPPTPPRPSRAPPGPPGPFALSSGLRPEFFWAVSR